MRRRVFAISDLHIGGAGTPMLGHPEHLEGFLEQVAAYEPPPGTEVELVIHGDFVDFLAEQPYAAWTADEAAAWEKFGARSVGQMGMPDQAIFEKIAEQILRGERP
jgi:hypothetical protein